MAVYGGLNTQDTLQALRVNEGTVAAYGYEEVWSAVNAAFVAHNLLMKEQLEVFASTTTQRLLRYGNPQSPKVMEEHDEYGESQVQKGRGASDVGFPLRKFGSAIGWNNDYFLMTTTKDFAAEVTQIFDADVVNITKQLKRCFYMPTNYVFEDMLTDHYEIPVKRLVNADGSALPLGPNGLVFDGATHTHYLARAGGSFVEADFAGLLNHVTEHFTGNGINAMLIIDSAQEATIRTFTDFMPYLYEGYIPNADAEYATGKTLDIYNTYNRAIGKYRGVEVWIKPWAIANYVLAMVTGNGIEKPVAIRVRGQLNPDGSPGAALPAIINGGSTTAPGIGDLRIVAQYDTFPMHATEYQREFGMGVRNRVSVAVLYVGGTTYVAPTIS